MDRRNLKKTAIVTLGLAFTIAATPLASFAQERPSYASHDEDTIKGRIVSITGQYDVSIRDDRGYVDHVRMHQGTIINPNGLSLAPGMSVTVLGVNEGSTLAANEIDTPYTYDAAPAYADYSVGYGYPAYGYPYGVYGGYPFGYGFGYGYPGVAIGFNFGFGGYGYGGYHGYHGYRGYGGYHGYGGGYRGGYIGGYNRGYANGGYNRYSGSRASGGYAGRSGGFAGRASGGGASRGASSARGGGGGRR